jgi:hypothetical protein
VRRHSRRLTSTRPWKVIVSHDADRTLEEGDIREYVSLFEASRAFAMANEPLKALIHDDGVQVRELDDRERTFLEAVCAKLGYDIEQVGE